MAYTFYPPQYYPNSVTATPTVPNYNVNQQSSGIIWVQGEAAAKSYPVSAGQSVLLMDSETPVMYIKSTDQSGMPLPLRIFDYKERNQNGKEKPHETKVDFVSREEFDKFKEEIKIELKRNRRRSEEQNKDNN